MICMRVLCKDGIGRCYTHAVCNVDSISKEGDMIMNRGLRQKLACFLGLFIAAACSDGNHENTSDSQAALQTGQPGVMSPMVAPTREPNGAIGAACGINVTRQSDSSPLITTPKI